jgi:protein-L-isoaspartate(D-aspartate) O-methyltransferase
VPAELAVSAYVNRPLAIGHGQTISQPYIVALMTDLLDLQGGETVLEIGTGSGYQAAVLAEIAGAVHTVECVADLSYAAQAVLNGLGYRNINFRIGDGRLGWPEAAPFPAIMVTAAAESVPDSLVAQLAPGGRMILPVGKANGPQNLIRLRRDESGRIASDSVLSVAFVPLVGGN